MPSDVDTLMEMGFPQNRAEKALAKTNYKSVNVAMDWLFAHSEDADIDDPYEPPKGHTLGSTSSSEQAAGNTDEPKAVGDACDAEAAADAEAKSLKCDDCGKVLRNVEEAEFHAVKSGHSNFSESTEAKKALTDVEKKAQIDRLQEKLKQKRLEKQQQEKEEQIVKEKIRRAAGKDMSATKAKMEEDEMKKILQLRKREKEDEKLARQRVKDEIERDKKDRAAKLAKQKEERTSTTTVAAPPPSQPPAQPAPKKEYTEARIQIRLPNGSALTQTFGAKEPLAAVRLYIIQNRTDGEGPFKLMMNFPKKVFTEEDMEKPLSNLGLVPSAVLMVSKT